MDTMIFLLVISTLPSFAVAEVLSVAPFHTSVEQLTSNSRIFSGEGVQLRCRIPEGQKSTWHYLWFHGATQLPLSTENFTLWNAKVKEGGEYSCQGERDTMVGPIRTLKSQPVEIHVDGGWAILQVTPHPVLVGETLKMTCRVRRNPKLSEVILYKDGVEFRRQSGFNPHFNLTVRLEDQGLYSCRATWTMQRRSHSVISVATQVYVLEVLTKPVLEIVLEDNTPTVSMRLVCHLQYNSPAPAPPISYYFYRNGTQLSTSSSENNILVNQKPGQYSCKARVPKLDLLRWSDPKTLEK
ncbi:high affinity immunoglobulin gamma Fc receptor I-like isoform X2 [Thalassophryne amazonica]|uniref:high affinity immunoglobulin gamma Fc receptor I-like isoform X2 n=1 Tax=Thalassophryne amazonica TaxID=390379 RepID=UPI001471EB57|nr:high affinity immunoglobulin gamma Fc receptor I-like isoform X2 [Thalassophryne amazonica]